MMLLVAAHPRGADPRQLEALDLVAQALEDVLGALTTAVVTPDRGADEDVQVAWRGIAHHEQWSPTRPRLRPVPACESTARWT